MAEVELIDLLTGRLLIVDIPSTPSAPVVPLALAEADTLTIPENVQVPFHGMTVDGQIRDDGGLLWEA